MRSLFSRLLKLFPNSVRLEEFFTEIITHLFESSPHLMVDWLKTENIIPSDFEYISLSVRSEVSFNAILDHPIDSRIDFVIEMIGSNNNKIIIFIESKISASEGTDQLKRYADHLAQQKADKHILLYITRDFDPKEYSFSSIFFYQRRWRTFYIFLKKQQNSDLVVQILHLMEDIRMSSSHFFTPLDIVAIKNRNSAQSIMKETLSGDVERLFRKIFNISTKKNPYEDYGDRYILAASVTHGKWVLWCELGYFTESNGENGFPDVGITFGIPPESNIKEETINSFKKITSNKLNWLVSNLERPDEWPNLYNKRTLGDFINHADHVVGVKEYFLQILHEIQEIKDEYPDFPMQR